MKYLSFEKKDKIGILQINRPEALNALNKNLLLELKQFLSEDYKKEGIRVLILTGSGEKAFIAGADIKEMLPMSHLEMSDFFDLGLEVTKLLENVPLVTIAAVNGFALGGGLEIALACNFIYASSSAKMGLPEVSLGLIPGFGGTQRLSRAVGKRVAMELIMTGKHINAEKAHEIGLVNRVCDPVALLDDCTKTAVSILKNGFIAVLQGKRAIQYGYNLSLEEALQLEKNMCCVAFATPDRLEGMQAFTEKRKPDFS